MSRKRAHFHRARPLMQADCLQAGAGRILGKLASELCGETIHPLDAVLLFRKVESQLDRARLMLRQAKSLHCRHTLAFIDWIMKDEGKKRKRGRRKGDSV